MKSSSTFTRYGVPLSLAVIAAVGYGIVAVAISLVRGDRMALPGAAISLALYAALGFFALRGHPWARWVLFTFALMTALTCLFFSFISVGSGSPQVQFSPVLGAVSIFFASIAIAAAVPPPRSCKIDT